MEGSNDGAIDLDTMTTTLEPDKVSSGGLFAPGKDRVVFRPPERKSLLGLDVLANAKRESKGVFRVPKDKAISAVSSIDEDEKSMLTDGDDLETNVPHVGPSKRRYRGTTAEDTPRSESGVTSEGQFRDASAARVSNERLRSEVRSPSVGSSRTVRSHSPSKYDRDGHRHERRDYRDDTRSNSRSVRQRYDGRETPSRYTDRRYSEDSRRDRNKYGISF